MTWNIRTVLFPEREHVVRGYRISGPRELVAEDGRRILLLNPPERRVWSNDSLVSRRGADWGWGELDAGVSIWSGDRQAEADLIEMGPSAAGELHHGARDALAVTPMCVPLKDPEGLSEYLVGGRVIAPGSSDPYPRFPVDQTALSLYRIARWHGGAFWQGVANHIATVTLDRVERAPTSGPTTNLWGHDEVHVRFLADAILLLMAHAETHPGARQRSALTRACEALERFTMPWEGGSWMLHDSLEHHAARNDLVLNTHVHGIVALHAAGRETAALRRALDVVLSRCVSGPRAYWLGGTMMIGDLTRAYLPRRVSGRITDHINRICARYPFEQRRLRFPGGFIARDASGRAAPWYYLAVNLNDLAVASRNFPSPAVANALRLALRFARRSRFFTAQLRWRDSLTPTIAPTILRNAGDERGAEAAAARALRAGLTPVIGWPGYVDSLWSRLAPGTP